MPDFVHRTTKAYQRSISYNDLAEPLISYIENPDLRAVIGQPSKYWAITGDVISLMTKTERDAVDAADLSSLRDSIATEIDQPDTYLRAFALLMLDEVNLLRSQHSLPNRTPAQLKTALRARLDT